MAIKVVDGKYVVSVYKRHPLTRKPVRIQKIVDSHHAAVRAKAELERTLRKRFEDEILKVKSGKMKYSELLTRFYASLQERDLSVATVENYKLCLDAHTLPMWGNRPIDEILPDEIRKLIKERLADKSKSHQKSMLKFMRGVFDYAVETGHLPRSPVPFMQFRFEAKLKRVLNETQATLLLEKAKQYAHEWYAHWSMALYTGMRNEELYALTWLNVDFENRLIFVREVWTKKGGFKAITKNGHDRVVEIAHPLVAVLKELKLKDPTSPFVLPRIEEWTKGRQAEILRLFMMGLNMEPISFHALRASWATLMLSKGVAPVKVMKMGGWLSLKTLEDHYVRLSGVDIKGMTDKLNLHDPMPNSESLIQLNRDKS